MLNLDERTRLWNLVEETIARWRGGEPPDAAGFLARHPEIGSRKTLALDLIHEELCLRKESGDTVVASTFIERFPDYRSFIAKMLAVEQYSETNPDFAVALGESAWPQVGQEYQGFEIVEPLGRGAVARVYLARETAMGRRPVVIKVSQHGGHEAHLLGKLEHPSIVAAHSVKQDEVTGMTVICMPLLGTATGLDLLDAAFRKSGPPATAEVIGQSARRHQPTGLVKEESLREAFPFARRTYVEGVAWLGRELATGLVAAGKLGVAHRDIKPSNVLLAWSGRPMLLDFNLSSGEDQAGDRVGGTLAYMAPERIGLLLADRAAAGERVDPRPDIFSLGVVLYELLTGRLPVQPMDAEASDAASMRKWLESRSQPIALPSQFNRSVDAPVERIVLKCLAADPAKRYATAAEMTADLAAYLGPRATTARWARRNRRGLLAGGIAAAAALATGGVYWSKLPPYHEAKYQEGLRLYDAGDYRAAIQALSRSLEAEPASVKALFARGQSYYRTEDLPAAKRDFVAAATFEPQGLFWFCAGCCGLQDGSAGDYLGRALLAGYDEAQVRCNLGVHFEFKGDKRRALDELQAAIDLNEQLQQAYIERAQVLLNDNIFQRDPKSCLIAIDDIAAAEELGPPSRRLYFLGAMLNTLALKDSPASLASAEQYFRLMRARDNPEAPYENNHKFQRLLRDRPELAKLASDPTFKFVPDPPYGIGPPATADLSQVPAP